MVKAAVLISVLLHQQFAQIQELGGKTLGSIDQLKWMVGAWAGEEGGVKMEEVWTPPRGGVMLGLHRDLFPSGKVFFEFLRISETAEGISYWASPAGREATPFGLVESSQKRVVFENPGHDFPQRISYWLDDQGNLHARVSGFAHGEAKESEWVWLPSNLASTER